MSIKKFTLLSSFFILFIPLIQSQTLTLTYPNKQVCGNTVSIPLTVANFDSITGMQFSTTWDASILHFEAISGFNSTIGLQNSNFNLGNTNNGYFTFAWFASSSIETGYTLNDGDTMFIATFTVINTLQNQVPIQFSNVPTHINYSNAIVSADLVQDTNDGLVSLDNSGPSSTCPNDTLINIPSNQSSVAVGGLTPTFTDACGISSVTYNAIGATTSSGLNDASNSTFNVGTTVLTYTFSDILNNQSTCSFSINVSNDPSLVLRIVNDTVDCQAIASLDITASNFRDISRLQTSLNWDNAQLQYSSITNFGLPNFDISDFDLNFTNAGILGMNWENIGDIGVTFPNNSVLFTINFNVNSSNGQNFNVNFSDNPIVTGATQATTGTSVAIQTNSGSVVVKDSTNPTITCPSNQSYTIPITSNTSTVTDLQVTTSDNCPSNLTVGYNITGSTVGGGNGVLNSYNFLVGTSTVTYTATDLGGLSNSCSFTVDVIRDIQDTLIITPVSQTVNCDNGTVDVAFHVSNFDLVQLLNFDLNWDTNILTYNSINNVGLPGFDSSNIDETDTSLGILNIHYTSDFANGVTLPDNTQIFILRFNIIPTSNANTNINFSNLSLSIGTPQVNAMVIGQNGVISFQDQTAPVIICPGRVVQEVSNSTIDATVNFLTPLVNDNCTDDVQVTYAITGQTTASGQSDASGTTFNLGLSTLSYQAVDLSGNTTQCQTSVYVVNPLLVNLDDLAISCADTQFVMPLRVIHFDSISNLSFSITWDPTHLTLNDITDFFSSDISIANFDMTNVSNGKIGFSWNSTSNAGVFLNDNTALFNLVFKPTNFSINSSINVAITDDVNPINAVSGTIAQIDLPVTTNQTTLIVYDGESPTIDCPSDVYVGADTNERTATVNNITPSIFDNCEIQGVTYNISGTTTGSGTGDASGTQFNVGNSYVTYTVSDLAGNTDECSFRVRVRDTVLTVFTENLEIPCESNRIVPVEVKVENFNAITGVRFTMNWDPSVLRFDSVRNNANLPLLTDSNFDLSFTSLGLGSIVWYSAAPITLVDTSTIFTMYFLAIGDPGTSSQFDFTNTLVNPGFSSVNSSNQGVLISNFTLQNAQIDIIDEIAPTISCPPFIYSQLDEVLGATEIFGIGPRDTSDNCVIQSVLWSVTGATTDSGSGSASGTLFNEGYSNVTYTITDLVGNQSSCSFGVNVQPAVVPDILTVRADTTTISCETDTIRIPITVENFNLLLGLQYTMNWDPTVLEYVGIDIPNTLMGLDATDFGMSLVSNGSLTMSWYDLDQSGETLANNTVIYELVFKRIGAVGTSTTLEFNESPTFVEATRGNPVREVPIALITGNINVRDYEAPIVLTCTEDITVLANPNSCSNFVVFVPPTASDNCGGFTTSSNHHPFPPEEYPIGVTNVIYTFTDGSGNESTCSFNITVQDTIKPIVINCPNLITVTNDVNSCGAIVTYTAPTTSDNCDQSLTVNVNYASGSFFPVGANTVTYQVIDDSGNSDQCLFTVEVHDNETPVFTQCPSDVTVNAAVGSCGNEATWIEPTYTDNCNTNLSVIKSSNPGDFFPVGETIVRYTVTDQSGNSANCTFKVIVKDNQLPTFSSCPSDISINIGAGSCQSTATWTEPTATDNCGIFELTASHIPGQSFTVGTTVVSYTASDASGNSAVCSFNVIVTGGSSTQQLICPSDISTSASTTACGANVTWGNPVVVDVCNSIESLTSNFNSGDFFAIGDHVVTYTATTASTSLTCSFNVSVQDLVRPTVSNCPTNIDIQLAPQSCETAVNWTVPTFTDNCSMASVTNPTYNSGDIFQAGTYLLNYTGTDLVGNSNVCEFTINVIENTAPVIINCPQDQIINVADAECSANVTWTAPTATDNCGTVDLISNFSPGLFEVGTSIVIYTATDQSGNTTTCSFRVTVRDNIDPVIVDGCPQNISVEADPNQCGAVVNWTLPTATDNCSQTFMYLTTSDPGDFYTVGSHLVIVSALDASNNLASCSFQINVIDRDAPVVSNCPTEIRTTASIGSCSKSVSWTPPTFTDACDTTLQIIASANPGSLFPLGTTTVTYNALDESGNIASCSFDVIVEHPPVNIDVTPIATQYCVGSDVTLSIINGYNATFSWGGQNTSDTRDLTIDSITTADQGTYIAYVTFSNGCQYIDSVSILVNPTPNVAIQHNTVGCASNDSDLTLTEVGGDALAWNWSGPNFTSNLQSPTISNATPSNSGTYAVTVTNQFGCTNVAQQEILVQNTLASPLIYSNATEICQNQPFLMSGSLYANPNVQYYFFSSPATGSGMDTLTNGPVVSIIPTQAGVYSYYYYYTSGECVSDTASLLVTVLAAPNVNVIGSTNLMCVDSNTELTLLDLGGDATSWNWISPIGENISSTSGFTLSNLNESNIGTYTVNATNELGCTTKVEIPVSITFKPATPQITSTTTNHCLGSEISLTGTYYEGDSISYEWTALPFENAGLPTDVNSNTILVTPTSAGAYSYSYYVTNGSCISDPASFVIEVQAAPSVLAVSNSPITCLSLSDTLKLFETSGDATSWSWTGPNNFGSFEQNPIRQNISSSDAGIYTVVGYSSLGCVGYDTIEVVITQKPILPTISAQDLMVCLGDSIKIFGPNLPVGYEYNWVGPNVTSVTSQNLVISNAAASNTGAYSLIVTSQGCSSDASEPIYVYVLSAPDIIDDLVSISFGTDPVTFSVITNDIYVNTANVTTTVQTEPTHGTLINNNDGTFSYTPSGPFVETDQFIYKICYDECPTSCDVGIVTLDISSDGSVCVIPNVITPNDDQINDELYIPCLENDKNPNNELIIYNQWGDQVFYANPYLNNWKGTYNNKDLPDGTYYYLFKRTTDSTPVKGFITIYR